MTARNTIGIIIIGRNEGPRLAACLDSLRGITRANRIVETVYVDSGSTDESPALARSRGVQVVELPPAAAPAPEFTAARARNAGAQALLARHPEVTYLQFLDGDTQMDSRWLEHAAHHLDSHPAVAVACGRRREKYPADSLFNTLADLEWNTPIGSAREFGGDALIRAGAFQRLGGYRPAQIAGEEPELAARMHLAGHTISRLDHEMTLHDLRMMHFRQWFRRTLRSGHALAEVHRLHGGAPLYFYRREYRSTIFWTTALPAGICLLAWLTHWWVLLILPTGYLYLALRIARHRIARGDAHRVAATYALFTVLGKFPQLLGMLSYFINLLENRRPALIEYKSSSSGSPARCGSACPAMVPQSEGPP